jgi:hypothetical protein
VDLVTEMSAMLSAEAPALARKSMGQSSAIAGAVPTAEARRIIGLEEDGGVRGGAQRIGGGRDGAQRIGGTHGGTTNHRVAAVHEVIVCLDLLAHGSGQGCRAGRGDAHGGVETLERALVEEEGKRCGYGVGSGGGPASWEVGTRSLVTAIYGLYAISCGHNGN